MIVPRILQLNSKSEHLPYEDDCKYQEYCCRFNNILTIKCIGGFTRRTKQPNEDLVSSSLSGCSSTSTARQTMNY
ncbi:hypothetical protein ACHWQZ_G008027 [Mnemiopsis leidyi]